MGRAFKFFKEDNSKDRRERIEDLVKILMESNEECMAILNRDNDGSFPVDKIDEQKSYISEGLAFLKSIKSEIKAAKADETRALIEKTIANWKF